MEPSLLSLLGAFGVAFGSGALLQWRRERVRQRRLLASRVVAAGRVARYRRALVRHRMAELALSEEVYTPVIVYAVGDREFSIAGRGLLARPGAVGQTVPVAYDPAAPQDAVTLDGGDRGLLLAAVAVTVSGAVALLLALWPY